MAQLMEPSEADLAEWAEFKNGLPDNLRLIAGRVNPWTLYRLRPTGQRVIVYSYQDDGTVTVIVSGLYNLQLHDAQVFGINPDDLEECDLPSPNEPVGSLMTTDEVKDNIDELRCRVRPDLWVMGEDGKAIRRQLD